MSALASWVTSATTHLRSLSCKASEKGFVHCFCRLSARSPRPPHYSPQTSSSVQSVLQSKLGVSGKKRLWVCTQYRTGRRISVYLCSLGLVCCVERKNLAGFPPLCNSLGRLLSPGDTQADVWVKRAIARIHGVFSMILINSVMLLVLRREHWTETVLRTTDSFFPKAKKCHFHELFLYAKAQNGFPKVCIWFHAVFTGLLN